MQSSTLSGECECRTRRTFFYYFINTSREKESGPKEHWHGFKPHRMTRQEGSMHPSNPIGLFPPYSFFESEIVLAFSSQYELGGWY